MLFNSMDFLVFFPFVICIYFVIPRKIRYIWLLVASYYFYMSWNPKYAVLIGISTIITYLSGIILQKINNRPDNIDTTKLKKMAVASSFIINLAILIVFKYGDFIIENANNVFEIIGVELIERNFDLLLPVGISFYTFQALSYTMDVYRGNIVAEKNIVKYALFVSFFPQLVAGPIERSESLITQIRKIEQINLWDMNRIHHGALLMMWGFFQKLVIADRAAILVNTVYNSYENYGCIEIVVATLIFAFQIYCDFDGYTNIARGAAEIMGINLMKNFKRPYLAVGIKDFWRRWHISLTSWFTDYLYIPLGGNRKGEFRTYLNIAFVFFVSGLWHGASWNYVLWGMIHALYQMVEMLTKKKQKRTSKTKNILTRIGKTVITFLLVDFAWLFFRANNAMESIAIIKQMGNSIQEVSLLELGLDTINMGILGVAILVLMIVDVLYENNISIYRHLIARNIVFRYLIYLAVLWGIILLGIYGVNYDTSQFIYFQF